jgi:flagellar hook-associated protein 2
VSSIQFTGLASGIDTKSIIDALMQLERRPLERLQGRIQVNEARSAAWGEINTKLLALKNSLSELTQTATFSGRTATSSDQSIVTATATPDALTGAYHLNVISLATATRVQSTNSLGQPVDPAAVLNSASAGFVLTPISGTFTINNVAITIDASVDTLNDVINRINASVPNVTASYNNETDRLVLSSNDQGNLKLGSGSDTSNFLTATRLLAAPVAGAGPYTKASTASLGMVKTDVALDNARLKTALTSTTSGVFKINGVSISYDTTKDTLNDVLGRINNSAAKVTASYDPLADKVILQAKDTGSINISLEDTSGNLLEALGVLNATQEPGANARFTIAEVNGGADLYSTANQVTGVIPGVTLNLLNTGTATVEIKADTETPFNKIKDFVSKYNEAVNLIATSLSKEGKLSGDISLFSLQQALRSKAITQVTGGEENFNALSKVGLNINTSGNLTINETKLNSVIASNPQQLSSLFNQSSEGVAVRLTSEIDKQINEGNGLIPLHQRTYENEIKTLNKSIEDLERRLEIHQRYMEQQFAVMEKMLAQFNATSNWLNNQITALTK